MHRSYLVLAGLVLALSACKQAPANPPPAGPPHMAAASSIEAGRYLVTVGGCNDCHTDGWTTTNGEVPQARWLTGTAVGWQGPWGTTYPSNLRLLVQEMDEKAFVNMALTRTDRPPMPWMNLNRMNPEDLRSIYRFIHSLGPVGEKAPQGIALGQAPTTPFIVMAPSSAPPSAPKAN